MSMENSSNGEAGMSPLISIGIPTYNRSALLQEAIESCFAQQYRPLEILVGDDSSNDEAKLLVERLRPPPGITLSYHRNSPSLGQAANVNGLFDRCAGSRLILLHDDNLLLPGGIDILVRGWEKFPGARCVYGDLSLIQSDGTSCTAEAIVSNNRDYFRYSELAGPQNSALEAALRQQMPADGFLIETSLARAVRYRSEREVGHAVDTDFSIRLAMTIKPGELVYLNSLVYIYRLTESSIMRSGFANYGHDLFFTFVKDLPTDPVERVAKEQMLHRLGLGASLDAARTGNRQLALRIMRSRYYPKPLLSHWTAVRLLCVASPRLGNFVGGWVHARMNRSVPQAS